MIFLKKSEGVTSLNVEELYIHQINTDGTITELVAIDNKDKVDIPQQPTVRRRSSQRVRRKNLAQAMVIGPMYQGPTAKDRDDAWDYGGDSIPWPAELTGMFEDDDGDEFCNKITTILMRAKQLREKPRATGVPISQGQYTAYPAVTTE